MKCAPNLWALAARHPPISLQEEDAAATPPAAPDPWYKATLDAKARLAQAYKEGFTSAKTYFETPLASSAISASAEPLRSSDKIAGILLTAVLVESVCFGVSFIGLWLLGTSEAFAVATSARLFAAAGDATAFRAATRLPRLLIECLALPAVLRAIGDRDVALRAPFVKDRTSQTIAMLAAVLLTVRALNRTVLAHTTAPAASVLYAALVEAVGPTFNAVPALRPVADAAGAAGAMAWSSLVRIGQRLVAIDAAARTTPINAAFYAVSDLERVLAAPVRLIATALTAWWHEVVVPLLKTLGWITVQTLG